METKSEIQEKVIAIICDKLGLESKEVSLDSGFVSDLGADSLDTVELIMEFEKVFEITIPDNQAEKILTVRDTIEYIEKNQN